MKVKRIKGFSDLLPLDVTKYSCMEKIAREIFFKYGFEEIRIPILEATELYTRSIGEGTDIVQKEMYTFLDRKGRSLSLRPEATAGIVRAYIENRLYEKRKTTKLFTFGPMFRYERPQKGRTRQFHQINVECFGARSYLADVEIIVMLINFLKELGLINLELHINSLGCNLCRKTYIDTLKDFLMQIPDDMLCNDCRKRKSLNPLRIFDCKKQGCQSIIQDAPHITDQLCSDCKKHFDSILETLDSVGLTYMVNKRLVRGLDYYTRTIFEVVSGEIGAQSAVAGGGRYDGLVKSLGGPDTPAIGFACGMERLALLMSDSRFNGVDAYIMILDECGIKAGIKFAEKLRERGFCVELDGEGRSVKSSLREANKLKAKVCVFIGEDEVSNNLFTVKNMDNGIQVRVCFEEAIKFIEEVNYDRDKSH